MQLYIKQNGDKLPKRFGYYDTNIGELFFNNGAKEWYNKNDKVVPAPKWFYEEVN